MKPIELAARAQAAVCAIAFLASFAAIASDSITVNPPVTANPAGTQGAPVLGYGVNVLSSSTGPGWSVTLPHASGSGNVVQVVNRSAWFIVVYPEAGESLMFFVANSAYAVYPTTYLEFRDTAPGQWDMLYNLASLIPVIPGVTGRPGGGQRSATLLQYGASIVTCADANDSVMLPIALGAGEILSITNAGTNSCTLFPSPDGKINDLAPNAATHLPPGSNSYFLDVGPPNTWVGGPLGGGRLRSQQATAPTCSSHCGTSATITGTDSAGVVTMGASGSPSSGWVVTFNAPWPAPPACVVQSALSSMRANRVPIAVQTTTTTMTVTTGAAPDNSDKYAYVCVGAS